MICIRYWSAAIKVCVALGLGLSAVPTFARFISMPPTARTWLDIRGNMGVENVVGADTVGQFFASENAIPLAEYDSILPLMLGNLYPNLHLFAEGSVNGNTLRSYVSGEGTTQRTPNIQMYNSSNDTFTLHGTPEQVGQSVPITAHFDVTGTARVFGRQVNTSLTIGQVFVTAKMGIFNPELVEFNREDLRISPFDASTNAVFDLRRTNQAAVSGDIDLHISRTFTVVVGTPFDIGYGLNIQAFDIVAPFPTGTNGFTADLLHTAMIDFDIPAGYSLTSELGWTPVPEPSGVVLATLGCVCLAAWGWRRPGSLQSANVNWSRNKIPMSLRRIMWVGLAAAFGTCCPATFAAALYPDHTVYSNGSTVGVTATLQQAARWSSVTGLSDGIQVAVMPGFAEAMGATNAAEVTLIEGAVTRAFGAWENSGLHFQVTFDGGAVESPSLGFEFDLFAVHASHPEFVNNTAFGTTALVDSLFGSRPLTNGQVFSGYGITGVDVYVNIDRTAQFASTFMLTQQQAIDSLQRLLMHEIGHGIGMGHSNVYPDRSFDSDNNPFNSMPIDGAIPFANLLVSGVLDTNAIMSNMAQGTALLATSLSNDDRGGRDFLYPVVPGPSALVLAAMALAALACVRNIRA